ncbi:MAG: methyltransferase [Chloroflexi bacterium]|nr:methyltransferase [Chloroflexota bacterium]
MDTAATPTPALALRQWLLGAWASQALSVMARLNLADHLVPGSCSCATLAERTGTHAPSLGRVLRALVSVGVLTEDAAGCFALTPMGELLRADVPGSLHAYACMISDDWSWRAAGDMLHTVQTGQPALHHLFGLSLFEYLTQHPDEAARWNAAMAGRSAQEHAALLATYDFSGCATVVDVGGGSGAFLAALLGAYPALRGVLFDLPTVVEAARPALAQAGVLHRCALVGGDFFGTIPAGGSLYLLKRVLHDWTDAHAIALLRRCRAALRPTSRLLVIEGLVSPDSGGLLDKLLDLRLLVNFEGRGRTEAEQRALLTAAGFEVTRVLPTAAGISVLESVPC